MAKKVIPTTKVKKVPGSIVTFQRRDALIARLSEYIDDQTISSLNDHVGQAIILARKIVANRNISRQVKLEDAGFYDDPFIIPDSLAEYTQAGPASVIAAVFFASLRPVRGGDPTLHEPSMKAMRDFVKKLPQAEYGDVPEIIMGAMRMRGLDLPPPMRPILTVEDLLAEPDIKEARNNQRRLAMIRIAAEDLAITLRLAQQLVRLQNSQQRLPDITDPLARAALLKELYYMRHSYIPLADTLGQRKLVEAMQDEVLRHADPIMHQKLHESIGRYAHRFAEVVDASNKASVIDNLCELISSKLPDIPGLEVYGRVKSPYSLWLKMHEKGVTLETMEDHIFDYIGITARFDFPKTDEMTRNQSRGKAQTIGMDIFKSLRHQRRIFTIVPQTQKIDRAALPDAQTSVAASNETRKRKLKKAKMLTVAQAMTADGGQNPSPVMVDMRNYMENPKANGYRAIHILLKVNVAKGETAIIDFHIVWKPDDDRNTFGNASHASFKMATEGSQAAKVFQQWQGAGNQVYVQVGNQIRELQLGSTVADAAASVHSGIVAIAKGAVVTRNDPSDPILGEKRPLHAKVKNGDTVVVITHNDAGVIEDLVQNTKRKEYVLRCLRPRNKKPVSAFFLVIDNSGLNI